MIRRALHAIVVVAVASAVVLAAAGPAAASSSPVVATWKLQAGFWEARAWRGAMWVVRTDDFHSALVQRVDPATNTLAKVTELRFASGGFAVGYGSLWVGDWYGNAVWRLAPDGTVQARIPTGLQPGDVQVAFGSVWTANHHGASVTRIDPATDGVTATITVGNPTSFRDGPGAMTAVGARLWVANGGDLDHPQAIEPATDHVVDLAHTSDGFCSSAAAVGARLWSADPCTNTLYAHRADGAVAFEIDYPATAAALSVTTAGGTAWVGVDRQFDPDSFTGSHGVLEQRDTGTGALIRTVAVGGDVSDLVSGFGSLWVFDGTHPALRRVDVGSAHPVSGSPVR